MIPQAAQSQSGCIIRSPSKPHHRSLCWPPPLSRTHGSLQRAMVKKGVIETFQWDFQQKHISTYFRYAAREQMDSNLCTNPHRFPKKPAPNSEVIGTLRNCWLCWEQAGVVSVITDYRSGRAPLGVALRRLSSANTKGLTNSITRHKGLIRVTGWRSVQSKERTSGQGGFQPRKSQWLLSPRST